MIDTFKLPPGRYLIIDPFYVFNKDDWCDAVGLIFKFPIAATKYYKGYPFCAIYTAYGDDCYEDNLGRNYVVDSGLIGAVSEALVFASGVYDKDTTGGYWIESKSEIECYSNEGTLHFGDVVIKTGDDKDEGKDEADVKDEDEHEIDIDWDSCYSIDDRS